MPDMNIETQADSNEETPGQENPPQDLETRIAKAMIFTHQWLKKNRHLYGPESIDFLVNQESDFMLFSSVLLGTVFKTLCEHEEKFHLEDVMETLGFTEIALPVPK